MSKFLRVGQAAKILGLSPAMVRKLEKNGRLLGRRLVSGERRFPEEDVLRFKETLSKDTRQNAEVNP